MADNLWAVLTIYLEAEGESLDGKTAVAEVILRRTVKKFRSDGTVASTVLWPKQFSCWNADAPNRIRGAQLDSGGEQGLACLRAWERAIDGSNLSVSALFYLAPRGVLVMPDWAEESLRVSMVGRHWFYRDKKLPSGAIT